MIRILIINTTTVKKSHYHTLGVWQYMAIDHICSRKTNKD